MSVMNDRSVDSAQPSPASASPSAPPAKPAAPEGSVKETIESIIVAFIFAFIFRGFIVEAFVIPTGSMATTLMGAHMHFRCQDCGFDFDVNYPGEGSFDGDDIHIPRFAVWHETDAAGNLTGRVFNRVVPIYCPNCGFKVPRMDASDPRNDATAPPVRYGDRILVLKYLYLASDPQRWDVVVFKSPYKPALHDYTQNYIKRLVGKPGEAVYILDGDIYVGAHDAKADEFVVQTKPRRVQEALWRVVYDNDYHPRGLGSWVQPWKTRAGESGWDTGGRDFRFDNPDGAATIEYDRLANPDKYALTDWLGYNLSVNWPRTMPDAYHLPSYPPDNNVSDVKLSLHHHRTSGDGPLQLTLSKLNRVFTATILPDRASLAMHDRDSNQTTIIARDVPLPRAANRARRIDFSNVDYQVTLRIDGRDVIQTTPEQYRPDIPELLDAAANGERLPPPQIAITAARQSCTLSHISLSRDTYYMNRTFDSKVPVRWGSPINFPDRVMVLCDDEYFVLGDNSPISGDARVWEDDIRLPHEDLIVPEGVVPGRFMIGKAFFVYWPAGFRPIDSAPAVVPNFGDMRFIH